MEESTDLTLHKFRVKEYISEDVLKFDEVTTFSLDQNVFVNAKK